MDGNMSTGIRATHTKPTERQNEREHNNQVRDSELKNQALVGPAQLGFYPLAGLQLAPIPDDDQVAPAFTPLVISALPASSIPTCTFRLRVFRPCRLQRRSDFPVPLNAWVGTVSTWVSAVDRESCCGVHSRNQHTLWILNVHFHVHGARG